MGHCESLCPSPPHTLGDAVAEAEDDGHLPGPDGGEDGGGGDEVDEAAGRGGRGGGEAGDVDEDDGGEDDGGEDASDGDEAVSGADDDGAVDGEAAPAPAAARLAHGARVYRKSCATCHGVDGDGEGPSARYLSPAPRDFTSGLYKLRGTMPATPPSDADIARTIREGVPGTSMPGWGNQLNAAEIRDVVGYLKAFSDRFDEAVEAKTIEVPPMPALDAAAAQRGVALYTAICASCHGAEGRGDGPAGVGLVDEWGAPIKPADFTRGVYKSGDSSPEDLYRTVATGMEGTPMAPWLGLPAEQRWDIVAYVLSFAEGGGYLGYVAGRYPRPVELKGR